MADILLKRGIQIWAITLFDDKGWLYASKESFCSYTRKNLELHCREMGYRITEPNWNTNMGDVYLMMKVGLDDSKESFVAIPGRIWNLHNRELAITYYYRTVEYRYGIHLFDDEGWLLVPKNHL